MARLTYEGVRVAFPGGAVALDDVTLDVEDGEFMVLLGPSGSGKSTLLRVMAGLEAPTAGKVLIDGHDVSDAEPRERDLAMVFQAYALYPHKTVRENLEFGLRMRGMAPAERRERADRIARTLDIEELLERKPGQLSGGQRQRVALGRALVREPKAFLLDEPLSNLDPALRLQARTELARLHRGLKATFLYVTHDQEEAMTLGDRVAVLREGRVQQVAAPMELYRRPATRFVAEFIGSPAMNLVRCAVERRGASGARLRGRGLRLDVDAPVPEVVCDEVVLGVRPHDVVRVPGTVGGAAAEAGPAPDAVALVDLVEPRGSDLLVRLRLGTGDEVESLAIVLPTEPAVREGDQLAVRFPRDRLHYFDVSDGRRIGDNLRAVPHGSRTMPSDASADPAS